MLSMTNYLNRRRRKIRDKMSCEVAAWCNLIAHNAIDDFNLELSIRLAKLSDEINKNQWQVQK